MSDEVTEKLTSRLQVDAFAFERFCLSFGLDPEKLRSKELWDIKDIFPDTPVKMLKGVFRALKLFDLVELLEKAIMTRTLRPALSLREIEKLPSANNRPIKICTKLDVLMITYPENAATDDDDDKKIGLFKALDEHGQITTLKAKAAYELCEDLEKLKESKAKKEHVMSGLARREVQLKECLEEKIPISWYDEREIQPFIALEDFAPRKNEELLSLFQKEELAMRQELRKLKERIKQLTKESIPLIENVKLKQEEIKGEHEKFKISASTVIDEWKEHTHEKG